MLKMFQNVMLGETNTKVFAAITTNEIITLVIIIAFLLFFGLYPKPITDLVNPAIKDILIHINR
jgi:NADH-quinone oxidoreductase subunit M